MYVYVSLEEAISLRSLAIAELRLHVNEAPNITATEDFDCWIKGVGNMAERTLSLHREIREEQDHLHLRIQDEQNSGTSEHD